MTAAEGAPGWWQALRREGAALAISAAVAAFHLFVVRGYRIYSGDQRQYFLHPFRELSPDFIPRDWLTWQTSHYHAFFGGFVQFVGNAADRLGVSFEVAIFAAYGVLLVALFRGVLSLVRSLGGGFTEYLLTLVLVFCYEEAATRGPADSFLLPSGYLVPSGMAGACAVFALALLLRGRWTAAAFCCGLAGMIHVNYGIAGAPLLALFYLILRQGLGPPAVLLRCTLAFTLPFAVTFVPLLPTFVGRAEPTGAVALADVLRLAAPGHYTASAWPVLEVVAAFLPLLAALVLLRRRPDQRLLFVALAAATAAFAAVYVLQLAGSLLVARLYFWRLFPCLQLIGFAVIAGALRTAPRRIPMLAALGVCHLALSWLRDQGAAAGGLPHLPRAAATVAALALLAAAAARIARLPWAAWRLPVQALALFVLCAPAVYLQRGHGLPRFEVVNRDPLCTWLGANTDPNGLFLVPPMLGDVRVLARRAVIATAGQFPLGRADEMAEWLRRLRDCNGIADLATLAGGDNFGQRLHAHYLARPVGDVVQTMRDYGAEYFVTTDLHAGLEDFLRSPQLRLLHRVGGHLVFARAF